jgi:hypothetical protein
MLPLKSAGHLSGSIFWGFLGAFSSQLFSGLNRIEHSLRPSPGVAQERRFTSLTVGKEAVLTCIPV